MWNHQQGYYLAQEIWTIVARKWGECPTIMWFRMQRWANEERINEKRKDVEKACVRKWGIEKGISSEEEVCFQHKQAKNVTSEILDIYLVTLLNY